MTLACLSLSPPDSPPELAANPPPAVVSPPRPGEADRAPRFKRTCPECGTAHTTTKRWGAFCSPACRKTHGNRRRLRGALIYDLFMALRHERGVARAMGVWTLLCRLAQAFREEDERERGGRKSWRAPADVIAEHPWLNSVRLGTFRWKRPNVT